MEIIPNSTVILCHNVPLESNYENTIFWKKTQVEDGTQETYFKKFEVMRFNNQYYQRKDKGSLKLEVAMEKIFDCNYMMFRNSSFEKKWFYAFVDRIEYVNNVTCTIYYTIDIMQTYIGDYELNNCFVEREHSKTDEVGDNLVPENLEKGDYIATNTVLDSHIDKSNFKVLLVLNAYNDGVLSYDVYGSMFGGAYQGVGYKSFAINSLDDLKALNKIIHFLPQANIVGMYMFPSNFLPAENVLPKDSGTTPTFDGTIQPAIKQTTYIDVPNSLNGYIPKNKKMFTSPYTYLSVSNLQGDTKTYEFEYFTKVNDKIQFDIASTFSAVPSLILEPRNYNGQVNPLNDIMELGNFPQCAWTSDGYRQWVYNGGILNGLIGIGSASANIYGSMLKGSGKAPAMLTPVTKQVSSKFLKWQGKAIAKNLGGLISIGASVAETMAQGAIAERTGNSTHNVGGSVTGLDLGLMNFQYTTYSIREDFARNIDGYFTMYGYATNRIKKPNRAVRTNCTYLKTIGCTINGSVPAEDEREICDIHDNGIRYWNGTNVFNGTVQVAKYLDGNEYITNAVLPNN